MKVRKATRAAAAAGVLAVSAGLMAMPASADPTGAKNSFTFPAFCDGSAVPLSFTVNNANGNGSGTMNNPKGQANFSPAHVAGSNQVFHPSVFDLTFTFTPVGAPSQSFTDTSVKPNGKVTATCAIDYTTPPDPDGNTISLVGTVGGYFT
jgi:hypothetical protein